VTTHDLLVCGPVLTLLAMAAAVDWRSRRIPNSVTFTMILSGITVNVASLGPTTGAQALLGFLSGLGLMLVLLLLGAIGAGDVKLMAGIGAWMGPEAVLKVFVLGAIIGAVIVLTQAIAQRRGKVLIRNSAVLAMNLAHIGDVGIDHVRESGQASRSVDRPLPYAVPVLIAMLVLVARSWR
jgi:prepilin peptidase CpaA